MKILLKWETGANPVQCRCCEGGEIPNVPLDIRMSGRIDREGGEAEDAQVRISALMMSLRCGSQ